MLKQLHAERTVARLHITSIFCLSVKECVLIAFQLSKLLLCSLISFWWTCTVVAVISRLSLSASLLLIAPLCVFFDKRASVHGRFIWSTANQPVRTQQTAEGGNQNSCLFVCSTLCLSSALSRILVHLWFSKHKTKWWTSDCLVVSAGIFVFFYSH